MISLTEETIKQEIDPIIMGVINRLEDRGQSPDSITEHVELVADLVMKWIDRNGESSALVHGLACLWIRNRAREILDTAPIVKSFDNSEDWMAYREKLKGKLENLKTTEDFEKLRKESQ
jgi:hypothetical protein